MLKRLYRWVFALAERPSAPWAMGAVSFAESSFFPIAPDVMLVPMALARPDRVWTYALICTLTSVAGGVLGYAIGALMFDTVGQWIVSLYGYGDKLDAFRALYAEWGAWIILIKGVTPIPYKLVTIASGFAGYDFAMFVLLSLITRGARFFIVIALISRFGLRARALIEERPGLVTLIMLAAIVGGFWIATRMV